LVTNVCIGFDKLSYQFIIAKYLSKTITNWINEIEIFKINPKC